MKTLFLLTFQEIISKFAEKQFTPPTNEIANS